MKILCFLLTTLLVSWSECRNIEFTNRCGYDIWISPLTNAQGPPLPEGIAKLQNNQQFAYQIPEDGWYDHIADDDLCF
jgi:hypothetical protein